ncbi:MAG: hypothetical protein ABW051_09780 [Burkholderiaceae bacterium]
MQANFDTLRALAKGQRTSLGRVHPSGALSARRETATGAVLFAWRYKQDGKDAYAAIGYWDEKANPNSITPTGSGYSIKAAMRAAEQFALTHTQLEDEGGFKAAKELEFAAKEQAKIDGTTLSLGALVDTYVNSLKAQEKKSWKDVQSAVNVHVKVAQPLLAAKPANKITSADIADILRAIVKKGHGPHSVKVRAHLNRAYTLALQAPYSSLPSAEQFKPFNVTENPVSPVPKETHFIKSAKDPLSLAELQTYWKAIAKSDLHEAAMLRTHLLLGGPRIEQMSLLLQANRRPDYIVLKDGKGRGGPAARDHVLPLVPDAHKAMQEFASNDATYTYSVTPGKAVSATHLSRTAAKLVGQDIPNFLLKRVRSGVETLLAANGVNKEIRGRLQSHGIGGVQDINYNAYEYLKEKQDALELLHRLVVAA